MKRFKMRYLVLAAMLVVGLFGAVKGPQIYEVLRFRSLYLQSAEYVETLRVSCPEEVSPERWSEENFGIGTAFANVCFSTNHVPLDEMERLTVDLRERITGQPIDLTTIDWVWDRLAATGPHGEQYVGKWRPVWQEGTAAVNESGPAAGGTRVDTVSRR
ncbi:MAG: hypothetical protein ACF8PG_13515 [Maioricimonas sp. JB045]